jgi:predicted ATP-grasp superfamily ATP-dependent carboligase
VTKSLGAIVIGGDYRGLGVVRSLGRRGVPVWVLSDEHRLAALSRYAHRCLPWPTGLPAAQLEYLLAMGERHRLQGWALIPTGDETAAFIARHHAALTGRFTLTTPPWEVLRWAYDKRLTYELAAKVGIDCPQTFYPRSGDELSGCPCEFPAILKPATKEGFNRFTHARAWRVDDRAQLRARYEEASTLVDPETIMVQELIPGGGEAQFSYAALCANGKPIASMVVRRTRQYPIEFGRSSTFVEAIEQPEVEEPARSLLAALAITGLVEVEFKRDPRDGRFKLLDINPRVWGWHTLGRRVGCDFPYLLWQLTQGEPVPEVRGRGGVRWIRTATDLPTVARAIWRGQLSVAAYLRSLRGPVEPAVFAWDDPLPGLLELPLLTGLALRRGAA